MSFFNELKRRNVFKVGIAYAVVAWLVLQVADVILNNVDAPGWVFHVILLLLGIGFLLALVFAWAFEMTPQGLKRESEIDRSQSITTQTGHKLNHMITVVMALALGYFVYDKFFVSSDGDAAIELETSAAQTETAAETVAAEPEKSIAVLPFVNMSNDPEQEYFSDGIAEELLNRLAKIPDLKVAARTSAFQFKGRNLDIGAIGEQLKVAHILEGSVRKGGSTLRITAQLIDSRSGYHLWSETYDRDATDVLKVQDEIASSIAGALQSTLGIENLDSSETAKISPEAYDHYLQARALVAKRWLENLTKAVAEFDKALAIEPEYSAAWSGRAFAYVLQPMWGAPAGDIPQIARQSAERALALDPDNAEAFMVRGLVENFAGQVTASQADFTRAHALAPGNVDVINMDGDMQIYLGAADEAERLKRLAMALDPLAFVHPLNLSDVLSMQGRYEEAISMAEKSIALGGTYFAIDRVFYAMSRAGRLDSARIMLEKGCGFEGSRGNCEGNRVHYLVAMGQLEQAKEYLEQLVADIESGKREARVFTPAILASLYIEVSEFKKAASMQQIALDMNDWYLTSPLINRKGGARLPEEISDDPEWLAVWADPRVADLITTYRQNLLAWRASQSDR